MGNLIVCHFLVWVCRSKVSLYAPQHSYLDQWFPIPLLVRNPSLNIKKKKSGSTPYEDLSNICMENDDLYKVSVILCPTKKSNFRTKDEWNSN